MFINAIKPACSSEKKLIDLDSAFVSFQEQNKISSVEISEFYAENLFKQVLDEDKAEISEYVFLPIQNNQRADTCHTRKLR